MILTPDDQVHPDTHAMTTVNNVIEVVNYLIAARPSLRNFMIADTRGAVPQQVNAAKAISRTCIVRAVCLVPVRAVVSRRY